MKRIDNYYEYDESKKYVQALSIKSKPHWEKYYKYNTIDPRMHKYPANYFKNKGWISWPDFLGTNNKKSEREYLTYERFSILFDEIASHQNIDLSKYFISQKDRDGNYVKFQWICLVCKHNWIATLINRARRKKYCPVCTEKNRKIKLRKKIIEIYGSFGEKQPLSYGYWDYSLNQDAPDDLPYKCTDIRYFKCQNCVSSWHESIISFSSRKSKCTNFICRPKIYSQELRFLTEFTELGFEAIHEYNHKGYECDIFIKELNLGIEIDGYHWHNNTEKLSRDKIKNDLFSNDFDFIRFRDSRLNKFVSSYKHEVYYNQASDILEPFMKFIDYIVNNFIFLPEHLCKLKNYLSNREFIATEKYDYIISNRIVVNNLNKLFPEIAKYFSAKNLPITADNVHAYENKTYWWFCDIGHDYEMMASEKTSGNRGCPTCAKNGTKVDEKNNAYARYPYLFDKYFNFKKNTLDPRKVKPNNRSVIIVTCEKNNCDVRMELRTLTRDSKSFYCDSCGYRNLK
jgi:rubrerythrin